MQDPHEPTSRASHRVDPVTRPAAPSPSPAAAESSQLERTDASIARMRALLDRPLSAEDLRANTALVAAKVEGDSGALRSILVFRVGAERLALDATSAHRVVPRTGVRRIPHRTNERFAGIASVGGELTLVARIDVALGIAAAGARALPPAPGALARGAAATDAAAGTAPGDGAERSGRFIVVGDAASRWAFAADLVEGVCRVPESSLLPPPATVRHAADGCTVHLVPIAGGLLGSTAARGSAPSDASEAATEPLVSLLDARRLAALFARSLA